MNRRVRIDRNLSPDQGPVQVSLYRAACSERGFSLLELVIVIAIIGILATFAFPAYRQWIAHSAVNNATSTLMAKMKQARTTAVAESRSVTVSFDTANATFTYDKDTTGACSYCRNEVFPLSQFSDQMVLLKNRAGRDAKFNSDGSSGVANMTIKLKIGTYYKCVVVNTIGRVYEDVSSNRCRRL